MIGSDIDCLYVDTSALARAMERAPSGPAVLATLAEFEVRTSSELLRIELRRTAARRGIDDQVALDLLTRVGLVPLDPGIIQAAEAVPPPYVGTLDALHLATILRLRENDAVHFVLTYDKDLARACEDHGIEVLSPEA